MPHVKTFITKHGEVFWVFEQGFVSLILKLTEDTVPISGLGRTEITSWKASVKTIIPDLQQTVRVFGHFISSTLILTEDTVPYFKAQ
jgi:hypothetical protein